MIEEILLGIVAILLLVLILKPNKNNEIKDYIDKQLTKNQNEQRIFNNEIVKNVENIKTYVNHEFIDFNHKLSNDFTSLNERTSNKINQLEDKITNNLNENYKANTDTIIEIQKRIQNIDNAQSNLKDLKQDINDLQNILHDKKNRGTFGEIELYSLMESSFGINDARWKKQYTFSNGKTVDAVIFGGETIGIIPIDSKFPLENYRRIYDDKLSNDEKENARKAFKNNIIKHLTDISEKYIIKGETSDFAYMFLPAEAIFAELYGHFPEIIDESYKKHVYIVSPTTLMAYLTAIKSIYLGQQRDKKTSEIIKELDSLSVEFARFKERSDNLYNLFNKLNKTFDEFNVTSNKITKKFNNIKDGEIDNE